jgi:hypothetical protein
MVADRRAFLSVSKDLYAKLAEFSKATGAPISILVELAVSAKIGAPLSATAKKWKAHLQSVAKPVDG